MEFIGAVFLQLVYLYFVENENAPENTDGFSVGAMFGMCILSTNHFTGAMINPAKALGPLILSFKLWLIPLYLFAPLVGSISGYLMYSYMLLDLDTEATRLRKDNERAVKEQQVEKTEEVRLAGAPKRFKEDDGRRTQELAEVSKPESKVIELDTRFAEDDEGIGNDKL